MAEETFLNEGGVQVTNARFVVPGQTYALSGVTSVSIHEKKPKRIGPIFLFIIGFFCLMGGFSGSSGAFVAALVFIGLGVLWWISNSTKYAVRLMTVHAAKGLEFSAVFISGLEEGLFPHERLDDGKTDKEEERRLFYVALTRAEKKIFLTYAHMRTIFGSQRINVPSSFLNDISKEHVETGNPIGGQGSGYETTVYLD